MKDKITTIEDLAEFIYRTVAKKEDVENVKTELQGLRGEVDGLRDQMKLKFNAVDVRFDKIENMLTADYQPRIEKVEKDVIGLKDLFAV